ncbi:PLP-dependent aminotransferase family protein [Enterobacteriaceae bacterium ESL0689]|nr:PLP-dependent aminotransferase family protein [Enterobacteriaceae bacterium ESL0689]
MERKNNSADQRLAVRARELKPSAVRELLKHSKLPGVISLGGGIPAPELFDHEGLNLAVQQVMSGHFNDAFQYGLTEGYPPLRQAVSELCQRRGIACPASRVYITSGSQQSLDIIARTLLDPGDMIVVERPTYLAALQVFQLAQANILSVDTDDNGMQVEQLATLLENHPVKAVYLVPTFGNPGGKNLSEQRRRRLVELAKQHHFIIIEDDPYGEIKFTDAVHRPLYQHAVALGCEEQVVYTSTFSKILAPGMRIGWIVMPEWLSQQAVIVKQAADLHTNMLSQVITTQYLAMNRLDHQIALIREDYRKKCMALADALESHLGEHITFTRPEGGMFLWVRFRYPFDTMAWLNKTLANGVVYVPGEAFYNDQPDTRTLRLSYSTVSEAGLLTAVERLAKSL